MKKRRLNNQVRKAFQGSSRGFVLLEILIAIAILGIIGITFMGALSTTSTTLILADERTTAESLARRQMEYVKSQGYSPESTVTNSTYQKISGIPQGYSIWSVNRNGQIVNGGVNDRVIGIPWDSKNNKPADKDIGLQKISLVIKCKDRANQDKVIYTFINNNPYWAYNVTITLEGYKVDR